MQSTCSSIMQDIWLYDSFHKLFKFSICIAFNEERCRSAELNWLINSISKDSERNDLILYRPFNTKWSVSCQKSKNVPKFIIDLQRTSLIWSVQSLPTVDRSGKSVELPIWKGQRFWKWGIMIQDLCFAFIDILSHYSWAKPTSRSNDSFCRQKYKFSEKSTLVHTTQWIR